MSRWFRLYDEVLDDPKVQRLPDRLFKTWINILCAASRNDGAVPPLAELAFMLRREEAELMADLAALSKAGLLDKGNGRVAPHNWNGRQFQSDNSSERVKRFRNGQRNAKADVSAAPPDTETDRAEAEAEQKPIVEVEPVPNVAPSQNSGAVPVLRLVEAKAEDEGPPIDEIPAALDRRAYPSWFEELWAEYKPISSKNATKADAFRAAQRLSAVERKDLLIGLVRYAVWLHEERLKRPDTQAKHLATFIHKRGWEPFLEVEDADRVAG